MKTANQNAGAKEVKEMIENKQDVSFILSFAKGYGFDLNSYSSHVNYINGKLSLKIRRQIFYYYL